MPKGRRRSRHLPHPAARPGWYPSPEAHDPTKIKGPREVTRDGRTWRIGDATDVSWIATRIGRTITSAIPPVFDAYATFFEVDEALVVAQEHALVDHLVAVTGDQPWWLGFLDDGAHDVVFDQVTRVALYADWPYVLVQAGPAQALGWRTGHMRSEAGVLPDLMFPADRRWLVSGLWDDTWTCIGGSDELVSRLERDPLIRARRVGIDEDATPPGHTSW